ncbi:MAG: translation initiation factor IF-2 [Acidobacteriota bacterium]
MAGQKIRIYDLAKELKLDNKKVLDDARREGVDVSVPSNTVPADVADRIRAKYFPKKAMPTAGPRLVKVVKKEVAKSAEEAAVETRESEEPAVLQEVEVQPVEKPQEAAKPEPPKPTVRQLKARPQVAQTEPSESETIEPPEEEISTEQPERQPEIEQETVEESEPIETTAVEPVTSKPVPEPKPQGMQVRKLRPQPGARMQPPPTTAPTTSTTAPPPQRTTVTPIRTGYKRTDSRVGTGAVQARTQRADGTAATPVPPTTPGHKPLSVYVPQDTRPRKRSRKGKPAKGEFGHEEGKHLDLPSHLRKTQTAPLAKPKPVFTEFKSVKLVEGATVKDFAEKLELKPKDVVQELFKRRIIANINQTLNQDVAHNLGKEYGFEVSFVPFEELMLDTEEEKIIESGEETLVDRAPVVTVMGHVDHGKTSLLDAIRQTSVAEGEAGGITQHIGAYAVDVPDPDEPERTRKIVFLDTPGHEAFTMMRARGAKVTDVVVLVVAADDGVMPQTLEAIDHAKAAETKIIVAINKIDKPDANPDRVKQELSNRGLQWEGWGGDTVMVEVSAKKKQNLDALLEMIILSSDLLELKANPDRVASGTVLEAKLDKGRGPVATVLVQQGSLRIGDPFIVGEVFGRVRAMFDDRGRPAGEAGPSTPVEVLGLQGVPHAGDHFLVVQDATQAQHIANQRQMQARQAAIARTSARSLEQLFSDKTSDVKELQVILKGDVQGSVEAVRDNLLKLSTDRVQIRIIRSGVGAITESDVTLAAASSKDMNRASVIIGFNVRPQTRARELAEAEGVDIRLHTIIYKVEEELRNAMLGLLGPTKREVILGHAEVRQVFKVPKIGFIAGCSVTDGVIRRTMARILRDNVVIHEGKIESLRRVKDDVSEVRQGFECGISLERFQDIKLGDVIESYTTEEVAATEL